VTGSTHRPLRPVAWLGLPLLLLGLAACGGGGGGGGGGGPTDPGPSITFSPSSSAADRALVLREGPGTTASRLVLELVVRDLDGLYGLSFDLRYPSSVLSFEAAAEEDFLGQGGADTTLQVAEQPTGNLVIGLSRLGRVPGASGSGVVLSLEFRAVGNGGGTLSFDANEAFDADGVPLPAVSWGAGSVQVVL